jgi:alpha-tubulin suppressor-like RCC1 family protein
MTFFYKPACKLLLPVILSFAYPIPVQSQKLTQHNGQTAGSNETNTGNEGNTRQVGIQVGVGKYSIHFIDLSGHVTAIGNRGFTGVGGFTAGAGSSGIPERVVFTPSDLKFKYAAGHFHGAALIDTAGRVWTTGENAGGEAGVGDRVYRKYPQRILTDTLGHAFDSVISVVPLAQNGGEGTDQNGWLALKSTGTIWVWGTIGSMQGNGSRNDKVMVTRPMRITIPGGRLVKQVVGGYYCLALCTDNTVWSWGGLDEYNAPNLGYVVTNVNQLATPHQVAIPGKAEIKAIEGGAGFNYALTTNNKLYGWGTIGVNMCNQSTVIYTATELTNVTDYLPYPIAKIKTSQDITSVILTDSSLWTWGDNTQAGIGNGKQYYGFGKDTTHGYAWEYQYNKLSVTTPYHVAPTRKFINIFSGNLLTFNTYAIGSDNQMYAWGTSKGSTIPNQIDGPISGDIAYYDQAWNRKWPQPINPWAIKNIYVSTSPYCVYKAAGVYPCNTYAIPANTKPVANAGVNQTIKNNTVTLDGTGSSDNVFVSYYEWSQSSGPNTAVIDLPASPTPIVSGLIKGTYVFKLVVIDNGWLYDSATVSISVNTTNISPSADAGPNQTISLPLSKVTLAGSGRSGDKGSIIKHTWTKLSGGSAIITDPSGYNSTVTGLTTGTYTFRLTVTQSGGETATSDVIITVNPDNGKTIPGKIEAEAWDDKSGGMYGIPSTDLPGGGQQVVGITNESWMDYKVNVLTGGSYTVNLRVATTQLHAQFLVKEMPSGKVLGTINIPNTGGWDSWQTIALTNVAVTAGQHIIRIQSSNIESCNFNWADWVFIGGK